MRLNELSFHYISIVTSYQCVIRYYCGMVLNDNEARWSVNPKYIISSDGFIDSCYQYSSTGMKKSLGGRGYYQVMLKTSDQCIGKWFKVHRLVADAFVRKAYPDQTDVIFLDRDKSNVNYTNLKWVTHSEALLYNKEYISGKDHWSSGKKVSEETKALQALAKTGAKHPKFKGYYIVRGVKYSSIREASEGSGIAPGILTRRCKSAGNYGFGFEAI